ncbi:MAG: class I SAM-dependent methyltransferase, partial [Phycisphaerales bacterium]|nr:class I SAM-dependent methyltransferase [Phycisphaerales bacterium]
TRRTHELPSPDTDLLICDACGVRARWAASRLRARGRTRIDTRSGPAWIATHCTATGPSDKRLWRAHALLTDIALPAMRAAWGPLDDKRALDLACGSGRDAVTMAIAGLDVEAWDRYAEALARCRELGESCGVGVTTRQRDVEASPTLATDNFDVIACFNFLHRWLMPAMAAAIRPGGFVVYETFTIEQRAQFGKPRKDAHLLLPGELPGFFEGWRIVHYHEGRAAPRRIVASLVAQRPE